VTPDLANKDTRADQDGDEEPVSKRSTLAQSDHLTFVVSRSLAAKTGM